MLTCGAWSCLQIGWTAMIHAAHYGNVEVVDRLLAAGADKDARTKVPGWCNGVTAMMAAAKKGHVEVVDRLLAAGADKYAQDQIPGCV